MEAEEDLLEAMLNHCKIEFFPKLRRKVDKFINVFNNAIVQEKVKKYFDEFAQKVQDIDQALQGSVFEASCCEKFS